MLEAQQGGFLCSSQYSVINFLFDLYPLFRYQPGIKMRNYYDHDERKWQQRPLNHVQRTTIIDYCTITEPQKYRRRWRRGDIYKKLFILVIPMR